MSTSTGLPGGARRFAHAVREIPGTWRRSLQLRVVSVTMVLSVVIALLLGWVLDTKIRDGLMTAKHTSSYAQTVSGLGTAQSFLRSSENAALTSTNAAASGGGTAAGGDGTAANGGGKWPTSVDIQNLMQLLCTGASDTTFQVYLTSSEITLHNSYCVVDAGKMISVPVALSTSVEKDRTTDGKIFSQPSQVAFTKLDGSPGATKTGIFYGQSIKLGETDRFIQIYYSFPYDSEEAALAHDAQLIAAVGALLILALGGIAWFVTRLVVSPVRQAAVIAERLADGGLDERMKVRGEDDLARLASSFNAMAANLQGQIRRLEELSRVQRRFVSDVSHELRTPLTTVRMAADVLYDAREDFTAPAMRSAELLQTQLDRFEELLSDLLEISRFDAGAAVLEAEPVDLRNLVHRVVDSSAVLAERRESEVRIEAPDTPCLAEIDPRRIERILRNLVVNAIEHSEGRPVVVKVATSEDAVAVAIRDYGVGLKPGESSLVFGRFWRADPARARTTGGTGLGLAISLEDARLHHGWLQAWGEPGGGSQFRLTLPRKAGTELLRSPIPFEPEDSRHHRRQVENARQAAENQSTSAAAAAVRKAGPDLTGLGGRPGSGNGGDGV